jgi:hypothetical protein
MTKLSEAAITQKFSLTANDWLESNDRWMAQIAVWSKERGWKSEHRERNENSRLSSNSEDCLRQKNWWNFELRIADIGESWFCTEGWKKKENDPQKVPSLWLSKDLTWSVSFQKFSFEGFSKSYDESEQNLQRRLEFRPMWAVLKSCDEVISKLKACCESLRFDWTLIPPTSTVVSARKWMNKRCIHSKMIRFMTTNSAGEDVQDCRGKNMNTLADCWLSEKLFCQIEESDQRSCQQICIEK